MKILFEFISASSLFSAMTLAVGLWESDKSGTRLTSAACLIGGNLSTFNLAMGGAKGASMSDTPKVKVLAAVILWFAFGYIGAAQWAGSFAGEYGPSAANVESLGECSRTSLGYFIAGPIGAVDGFIMSSHKPMWDWPKHLLEYGPQP